MIDCRLTPTEVAKIEMYSQLETTLYSGAQDSTFLGSATEKEINEVNGALAKKMESIHNFLGMGKIHKKAGYEPRF
jgi:hypothetical protein